MSAFLAIRDLRKEFHIGGGLLGARRTIRAVDGVTLSVDRGETVALVGESGSGKTTLGRCVLRLVEPTAGAIALDGIDLLGLDARALRGVRRRMQIVFQDPAGSLNPRMRVGAAVREPLEVHRIARGADAQRRVADLFNEVGLDPDLTDRYPHELSGGQKQRVGIARALAVEPEFLVLDEPVSALDVSVQAQVLNLLQSLKDRHGLTYLFISHDLAVVRHVADRVAVMYLGRVVETAAAESLFDRPRHPYTRALLSAVPQPTPGRSGTRIVLGGEPPSPRHPPPGCPFHPRCPHPSLNDQCRAQRPPLVETDAGHRVACHHDESPPETGVRGGG